MDAKIRETAEKIYVSNLTLDPEPRLWKEVLGEFSDMAQQSIEAAKVFHALCKDDMMQVKK